MSFRYLQAVILDWAGTTVDFGSLAPVAALQRVFEANGVPVTAEEVREHMGTLKKDQIRSICAGDRVSAAWAARHGHAPAETDVERLFAEFLPRQSHILAEFSAPIPGVSETVDGWRASGLRIGSTTGYTRELLEIVVPVAAADTGRNWPTDIGDSSRLPKSRRLRRQCSKGSLPPTPSAQWIHIRL